MSGRIFINYRRDDTQSAADALKRDLEKLIPGLVVYLDHATNEGGENYRAKISTEMAASNLIVSLIGPQWLEITDATGRPRISAPEDAVCEEIDLALDQGKDILPVLVDGSKMPSRTQLPDAIKRFSRLHAMPLREGTRSLDTEKIAARVHKVIKQQSPFRSWREKLLSLLARPLVAGLFIAIGYAAAVNFPNELMFRTFARTDAGIALHKEVKKQKELGKVASESGNVTKADIVNLSTAKCILSFGIYCGK
ncbi:MAG: toll/interleukin-1 receptor domain-containing protein [Alphaproteobacteria bacterium]|nr:toll/interleukin-1 receptor domain-containing protein [Alphaproteobacteria bacterium]